MATFRDLGNLQHGPSRAIRDMAAFDRAVARPVVVEPALCACGAPLQIDEVAEKHQPGGGIEIVRAAFCTGCEFVHEF